MNPSEEALIADLITLQIQVKGRVLLGLSGPPAAGKSTLAARLAAHLPSAIVLPMDGFHLDDVVLTRRGDLPRKGAPHTYDVAGLIAVLQRLRQEDEVFVAEFDRSLELSRAGAIEITAAHTLIIVEGNYLGLQDGRWSAVKPLLDQLWYVDVPDDVLRNRIQARWSHLSLDQQEWKLNGNDLPNARIATEGMANADRVLRL